VIGVKIHRVRLSDEEISIIRDAPRFYCNHVEKLYKKGEISYEKYRKIFKLALRFIDWGRPPLLEGLRPYYPRPRRQR